MTAGRDCVRPTEGGTRFFGDRGIPLQRSWRACARKVAVRVRCRRAGLDSVQRCPAQQPPNAERPGQRRRQRRGRRPSRGAAGTSVRHGSADRASRTGNRGASPEFCWGRLGTPVRRSGNGRQLRYVRCRGAADARERLASARSAACRGSGSSSGHQCAGRQRLDRDFRRCAVRERAATGEWQWPAGWERITAA